MKFEKKQNENNHFENVKVGDTLILDQGEYKNDAKVIEINDDVIICEMMVDVPRKGEFDRRTGISKLGEDYGKLKLPE